MTRSKTWALSVSGLLAIAAIFLAAYSVPAAADPTVAWSPSAQTVLLKPNTSTTTVVRLTATEAVANAQMRVTPSLTKYLTVTPTSVSNLAKGQPVDVTVTLSLPIDATADPISGTLQLRVTGAFGALGNAISKPLSVTINVLCPCLPPEPDPIANNATLAGVDSNNNGVRDDVERVLAQKFGGTPDFTYAMAYAKVYQSEVTNPTPATRQDALVIAAQEFCSVEGASSAVRNFPMGDQVLNTPARQAAMRALDDVLGIFSSMELRGLASCLN